MRITQVKVISETDGAHMICWIPSQEYKIKAGMRVSFSTQPDEEVWKVEEIYSTAEHFDLNRRWDVGGL